MSRRYSRGTTYTTSTAPDWRELLDDPEVTVVVHRVWYLAARTMYAHPMHALALDDLSSWLWARAADIAIKYAATLLDPQDLVDSRRHWLAYLYRGLKEHGLMSHRTQWYGHRDTARNEAMSSTVSIDASLDAAAAGTVATPAILGNRRLRASDPLAMVLLLERLEERVGGDEPEPIQVPVGMCSFPGCDRASYRKTGRLCRGHMEQERMRNAPDCTAEGCTNPQKGRGLCSTHYGQARRSGELEQRVRPETCAAADCDRPHYGRGLCRMHYAQARRGKRSWPEEWAA